MKVNASNKRSKSIKYRHENIYGAPKVCLISLSAALSITEGFREPDEISARKGQGPNPVLGGGDGQARWRRGDITAQSQELSQESSRVSKRTPPQMQVSLQASRLASTVWTDPRRPSSESSKTL